MLGDLIHDQYYEPLSDNNEPFKNTFNFFIFLFFYFIQPNMPWIQSTWEVCVCVSYEGMLRHSWPWQAISVLFCTKSAFMNYIFSKPAIYVHYWWKKYRLFTRWLNEHWRRSCAQMVPADLVVNVNNTPSVLCLTEAPIVVFCCLLSFRVHVSSYHVQMVYGMRVMHPLETFWVFPFQSGTFYFHSYK